MSQTSHRTIRPAPLTEDWPCGDAASAGDLIMHRRCSLCVEPRVCRRLLIAPHVESSGPPSHRLLKQFRPSSHRPNSSPIALQIVINWRHLRKDESQNDDLWPADDIRDICPAPSGTARVLGPPGTAGQAEADLARIRPSPTALGLARFAFHRCVLALRSVKGDGTKEYTHV